MNIIDLVKDILDDLGYRDARGKDEEHVEPKSYFDHLDGSVDIYPNFVEGNPIWGVSVLDFPNDGEYGVIAGFIQTDPKYRNRFSYYDPEINLEEIVRNALTDR